MRYFIGAATIAIAAAGLAWPLYGQVNEWPPVLGIPQPAPRTDSNRTDYGSEQSLYIRTFKVRDSLTMMRNTASYGATQTADFELMNDSWFGTDDQFFDFSGEMVKKALPFGVSAGLEWTPVLIYNKRISSQGILGSADAGPVIRLDPLGIPVMVHGGVSGRAWNDNIGAISTNQYGSLFHDKGYYAGAELGAPAKPFLSLPLYLNFKGYGRSMATSMLITGTGSALAYYGIATGDSVFALYTDSMVNGRDAFLGQAQGKPHFIDDPRKNERSYQLLAGFKGKPRYFLLPGIVYSYGEHTLSYLGGGGDRKNTNYAIDLLLKTDTLFPISYNGGFRIDWEREDKKNFFSGPVETPVLPGTANGGNQGVSLDDYRAYRVSMINFLSKYLQNGIGVEYLSDISRYSKDYPNYYVSGGDTTRNDLDNDIIVNRQKFTLVPIPSSWGKASLFFEYSKNLTNYIRKEMSGQNTVDWFYRIGGTFGFTAFDKCTLSEVMSSDAKVTSYNFPETKRGQPPPYSRKLSSFALADVAVTRWFNVKTEWSETYYDHGTWNAREYVDTSVFKSPEEAAAYKDYYAILDKTWEHGIKLSSDLQLLNAFFFSIGCLYQYIDARGFDEIHRIYSHTSDAGTRVSPFALVSYQVTPQLMFKAAFARTFDIHQKFWDIHVSFNGVF